MLIAALVLFVSILGAATTARCDERQAVRAARAADLSPARAAANQLRREWLVRQLTRGVVDPQEVRRTVARLETMSAEQIEEMAAVRLQELGQQRQSSGREEAVAAREALQRQSVIREQALARGAAAGFFPVITWFPSGSSFTTAAVISPDGRFARLHAFPFFSTIGPLHAFNFFGGPDWFCWPQYQHIQRHIHLHDLHHHAHHGWASPPPHVWHDGLRTRNEPRR